MVHHHRLYTLPRQEEPEPPHRQKDSISPPPPRRLPQLIFTQYLTTRPTKRATLFHLFLLFTLIYFITLLFTQHLHPTTSTTTTTTTLCSPLPNNTICCDTTNFRSDICFMRGTINTHAPTNSLLLHLLPNTTTSSSPHRIRPYTRKWEPHTMSSIDELHLLPTTRAPLSCDTHHSVPAVVFSTGGYTGNVYHEFNDGILPLYITSQHFNKQVVFIILEYHDWWVTKYSDVLSRLTDFPAIDFSKDPRTHCFTEAIIGLRIHDELTIEPSKIANNKTIIDFHNLLNDAYLPRIRQIESEQEKKKVIIPEDHPKLVIVSRNGSRSIENEAEMERLAEEVGFKVEVLRPTPETELAKIYRALNGCDAMVGVHGAAMTHFLFMRPGAVFIQVVPLGTDWAAEEYYGAPAKKMGLRYVAYKVLPKESSLFGEYRKDDPVLRDPESVNAKGWEVTKRVYLDGQKVRLDLGRFGKRLGRAYQYLVSKKGKEWRQGR